MNRLYKSIEITPSTTTPSVALIDQTWKSIHSFRPMLPAASATGQCDDSASAAIQYGCLNVVVQGGNSNANASSWYAMRDL